MWEAFFLLLAILVRMQNKNISFRKRKDIESTQYKDSK